jgi:hypothetical protein
MIQTVAWSPDGTLFASAVYLGYFRVWGLPVEPVE